MILIVRCYKISTCINFLAFSFSALVPTKFVIKPEISVTAYTARDFTLKCDIFGHPTPVVTWKRTHGELPVSRHVISGNKLTIRNTTKDEFGNYICQGVNPLQSVIGVIWVVVKDPG